MKNCCGFNRLQKIMGLTVVLCITLAWAAACCAHSMFIQSSRYKVSSGKSTPLFFCYGHHFPTDDGVRGKKLRTIAVTSPKKETALIKPDKETGLQSHMVSYDMPGTWTLAAETNPGYYTVYTDKKGKERHTIKPMSKIRNRAQKIHKAIYAKQYAKTYVVCETPSSGLPKPAGLDLELVPLNDLFALKPGENLKLAILHKGKPFDGEGTWDATYNGFSTRAEDMFFPKTKVTGPKLSVPIPKPGRWFIRYFVKVDAPEPEKDNYRQLKLTATLTFQIDNERKQPKSGHH